MINLPNFREPLVDAASAVKQKWVVWFDEATFLLSAMQQSGTTANRPTKRLYVGRPYFDTTLGKPIWYDGSGWVDATGTSA